ncbi:unnamed protein product, partial [Trichogramma brassicae]
MRSCISRIRVICVTPGVPGENTRRWVLVTLGKSAALLRKVQEVCSAQELTSEMRAAARRAVLYSAARTARDGGSSGGSGEPLLESRPRSGADPSEAEKRRRSAELGVTYNESHCNWRVQPLGFKVCCDRVYFRKVLWLGYGFGFLDSVYNLTADAGVANPMHGCTTCSR